MARRSIPHVEDSQWRRATAFMPGLCGGILGDWVGHCVKQATERDGPYPVFQQGQSHANVGVALLPMCKS